MVALTTLDGVKMVSLVYRAKSDNGKKENSNKANFLSYYLVIDCATTLLGIPADKKQHYPDGTRAPSKFINRCNFLE